MAKGVVFRASVGISLTDRASRGLFNISKIVQQVSKHAGGMQKETDKASKATRLLGDASDGSTRKIDKMQKMVSAASRLLAKFRSDSTQAGSAADRAGNSAKNAGGGFKKMGEDAKRATRDLIELQTQMEGLEATVHAGQQLQQFGRGLMSQVSGIAKEAGDLQMQAIGLSSVYGVAPDDSRIKEIERRALELSQNTLFSQKEVGSINLELAHAGISDKVLSNVSQEATYLAEIEIGMKKSSSAERSAYNFARMAEDAGITNDLERMQKFADGMSRVINVTHASSESLGEAFKYSMPVVKHLGWTEQDNLLATAMAERAGVSGSMAGTHIKDFAERINPFKYLNTKGGQKQLKAMAEAGLLEGIQTVTKKGGTVEIVGFDNAALLKDKDSLKSYAEMVDILSAKHKEFVSRASSEDWTKEMSEEDLELIQSRAKAMTGSEFSGGDLQWAALMNHMFGEQGQDFAIITSHKEMFDRLSSQLKIQKSLHKQIDAIRDSYNGQMHIVSGQVQTLGMQIGKPLMEMAVPALMKVTGWLSKMIKFFDDHPKIAKWIVVIAAGVAALALVSGGLMVATSAFGLFRLGLKAADATLLGSLRTMGKVTGVVGLLALAGLFLYKHWDKIGPYAQAVWSKVLLYGQQTVDWYEKNLAPAFNAVGRTIGNTFSWLGDQIEKSWPSISKFLGFTERFDDLSNQKLIDWEMPDWAKFLAGAFAAVAAVKLIKAAATGIAKPFQVAGSLLQKFKNRKNNNLPTSGDATQRNNRTSVATMRVNAKIVYLNGSVQNGGRNKRSRKGNRNGIRNQNGRNGQRQGGGQPNGQRRNQPGQNRTGGPTPNGQGGGPIPNGQNRQGPRPNPNGPNGQGQPSKWQSAKSFMGKIGSSKVGSAVGKIGVAGTAVSAIGAGVGMYNTAQDVGWKEAVSQDGGKTVGSLVGGVAGGALMSWAGPLGIAVGSWAGSWLGEKLGTWADESGVTRKVTNWAGDMFDQVQKTFGMDEKDKEGEAKKEKITAQASELQSRVEAVKKATDESGEKITSTMTGLNEDSRKWGENLMGSYISGISSKQGDLVNTMQGFSSTISDYVGVHSPTKEGPLRTNHRWGGNLVQSFADGMRGRKGALRSAVADSASLATLPTNVGDMGSVSWSSPSGRAALRPVSQSTDPAISVSMHVAEGAIVVHAADGDVQQQIRDALTAFTKSDLPRIVRDIGARDQRNAARIKPGVNL